MESRKHFYLRIMHYQKIKLFIMFIIGLIVGGILHHYYVFQWKGVNSFIYHFKPNAIVIENDKPIQIISDIDTLNAVKNSHITGNQNITLGAAVVDNGHHHYTIYPQEQLKSPQYIYKAQKGLPVTTISLGSYKKFKPTGILSSHPQLVEYIKTEKQAKDVRKAPNVLNADSAVIGAAVTPSQSGFILITRDLIKLRYTVKDYPFVYSHYSY